MEQSRRIGKSALRFIKFAKCKLRVSLARSKSDLEALLACKERKKLQFRPTDVCLLEHIRLGIFYFYCRR
mgnify:CR=1 FL=1